MTDTHALFIWWIHEAKGGISDLAFTGSLEACKEEAERRLMAETLYEGHVVDLSSLKPLPRCETRTVRHPLVDQPGIVSVVWSEP